MLYIVSIPLLVGFVSSRHLKKNLLIISQSTMYNTSYSVKCIQKWIPYSKLWTAHTMYYISARTTEGFPAFSLLAMLNVARLYSVQGIQQELYSWCCMSGLCKVVIIMGDAILFWMMWIWIIKRIQHLLYKNHWWKGKFHLVYNPKLSSAIDFHITTYIHSKCFIRDI